MDFGLGDRLFGLGCFGTLLGNSSIRRRQRPLISSEFAKEAVRPILPCFGAQPMRHLVGAAMPCKALF